MIKSLMCFLQIFCIASCVLLIGSAEAQGDVVGNDNASKHVRVGIYNNYPLIYEKGGQPTGFHLEILKDVAAKEGWDISYSYYSSLKNVIAGLETGSVDLGLGIEPTEERLQFFDFTTEKNAYQTGQIFVRSGRKDIQTLNELEGKTVALLSESVAGDCLIDTCERLKISPVFKRINSYQEMAEALATGSVDAGLFNEYHRQYLTPIYKIEPTPIVFKSTEVQYAVPKNENLFLIKGLDSYIRSGKITPKSNYLQLEKKFFPGLPDNTEGWGKRQIIIAVCLCLLLVILAIMVGVVLPHFSKETTLANFAREDVQHVIKFVIGTTAFFWLLDSLVAWVMFNDVHKLSLLEWLLTDIPPENLYLRGVLFLVASVFGLYLLKYLYKYQQLVDVLILSLNRFEQLTDNARDMIFRMSLPGGDFEFVSKASTDILGYSPAEFYQQPLLLNKIVHHDWDAYFSAQWEDLLSSGKAPHYYEYQVINKAGQVRWINQRNTVYLNESGKPYALEGIVTDITSQKLTEMEDTTKQMNSDG